MYFCIRNIIINGAYISDVKGNVNNLGNAVTIYQLTNTNIERILTGKNQELSSLFIKIIQLHYYKYERFFKHW